MSEDGKLRLVVKASQLDQGSPIYSDTVVIQRLPWKLMLASQEISHHKDQGSKGKAVGLFVQCMPEVSGWSAYAQVTVKMINHNNSDKHFTKNFTHNYSNASNDWGYSCFMKLKDILDPNKGFMKEGKITVEAKIQVQSNSSGDDRDKIPPVTSGALDTFLVCPSCEKDFEMEGEKTPMSLRCGHTFCLECLKKALYKSDETLCIMCSTCEHVHTSSRHGTEAELWFPNHSMVQIITNIMSKSKFFCREHQLDKDYYCFDDNTLVCIYCAYHSRHATHSCKHVEEARNDVHEILRKIKFSMSSHITDVDRQHQFIKDEMEMLKTQEQNVRKTVEDSYEQFRLALQKQKELLCKDIKTQMLDLCGSVQDCATKLEEKQYMVKEILRKYSLWQSLPTKEALENFGEMQLSLSSIPMLCDCSDLPQKPDSFPKLAFEVSSPTDVFNFSRFGIIVMRKGNSSSDTQGSDMDTQDYKDQPPTKKKKKAVA